MDSILSTNDYPRIVLVGRPNVGKSSLFNRLLHQKRSITDESPGVTRDPVAVDWNLGGYPCILVDTGGFRLEGSALDAMVKERALRELDQAKVILFVLSVNEMTPEDEEFIRLLRPRSARVVVVVNKADNPEKENAAYNYASLGFSVVIPVSALHGRRLNELEEEILSRLQTEKPALPPQPGIIKLAILGKPNVGKSTLVNKLVGIEVSLVSPIPGTTRDVIEARFIHNNQLMEIVDTAGIRRRKKIHEDVEYFSVHRAIQAIKQSDVVILLVNSPEGLSDQDKKIAWLVIKEGKGIILALNKWDLMEQKKNLLNAVKDRIHFLFPALDFAPIIPISAVTGEGLEQLLSTALRLQRQLDRTIETSKLNELLRNWVENVPPPLIKGRAVKFRYLSQVSHRPVRFVLFVNNPLDLPNSYVEYLKNKIRKDLGFKEIPLELEVKG